MALWYYFHHAVQGQNHKRQAQNDQNPANRSRLLFLLQKLGGEGVCAVNSRLCIVVSLLTMLLAGLRCISTLGQRLLFLSYITLPLSFLRIGNLRILRPLTRQSFHRFACQRSTISFTTLRSLYVNNNLRPLLKSVFGNIF